MRRAFAKDRADPLVGFELDQFLRVQGDRIADQIQILPYADGLETNGRLLANRR